MEAFKALDRDQTQSIDPKNLVIAFSQLGEQKYKLDQNEARKIIQIVSSNPNDLLNYEEFHKLMTMEPSDSDEDDDDHGGNGK